MTSEPTLRQQLGDQLAEGRRKAVVTLAALTALAFIAAMTVLGWALGRDLRDWSATENGGN